MDRAASKNLVKFFLYLIIVNDVNTKTGKWKDAPVEMMHEILERVKVCGRQLCDAKSYLFYPLVCRQIVPTFTKTRKLTR